MEDKIKNYEEEMAQTFGALGTIISRRTMHASYMTGLKKQLKQESKKNKIAQQHLADAKQKASEEQFKANTYIEGIRAAYSHNVYAGKREDDQNKIKYWEEYAGNFHKIAANKLLYVEASTIKLDYLHACIDVEKKRIAQLNLEFKTLEAKVEMIKALINTEHTKIDAVRKYNKYREAEGLPLIQKREEIFW